MREIRLVLLLRLVDKTIGLGKKIKSREWYRLTHRDLIGNGVLFCQVGII